QLELALQGKEYHGIQVRQSTGKRIITEVIPVFNERMCAPCHGAEDKVLGVVRLGLDWEYIGKNIKAARDWNVLLSLIGLVMMSLLIAGFFLKFIVFPIRYLETGMEKVSRGDLGMSLAVRSTDEIGELTGLFNKMTMDLKTLVEKEEKKAQEVVLLNQDLTGQISLRNELEKNLIESRQRLEDIIDFLPDATFVIDKESKIIAWNKAMEVMSGRSAGDMTGKSDFEYALPFYGVRRPVLIDIALDPSNNEKQENYPRVQKYDKTVAGEIFAPLMNDGKGLHLWAIATPLWDPKGAIVGAIESVRDITARKVVEAGLEKEKAFIDSAINSLPGIFYLFDKNGRFVRWNRDFEVVSGYSADEMASMTVFDFFAPDEKELIAREIDQVFLGGRMGVEARLLSKDGRRTPFVFTGFLFTLDGRQYLVGMAIDITARKEAEDKLRESEALLANALKIAHLGPWEFDAKSDLFTFNDHFYALFRTSAEQEGGYTMSSAEYAKRFVHPEDVRIVTQEVREAVEASPDVVSRSAEHRVIYRDGKTGYISVLYFITRDKDGKVVKTRGVNQDITDRKRSENDLKLAYEQLKEAQAQLVQSAKMASVGLLAGGVAHEINNPLTGILNNVHLIKLMAEQKKDFDLNDFKELLDAIEESSVRCTRITRSLLDFSRVSKENRQDIDLNAEIEKTVGVIEHEMKLNNIAIRRELDPSLPAVNGDIQLIQQVILDIISNAKWAIQNKKDEQDGVITIKTEYDPWYRRVYLFIFDTGIGIEKADLGRIFEPFFTTKPVGQGTGLGLAIVYNIIKDHNGTIEVQSESGQGTRFKITLPVVLA
ncbi:MAG: PAS domain S-box protein, partial [Candidatus Omnitrophota bacterium]